MNEAEAEAVDDLDRLQSSWSRLALLNAATLVACVLTPSVRFLWPWLAALLLWSLAGLGRVRRLQGAAPREGAVLRRGSWKTADPARRRDWRH